MGGPGFAPPGASTPGAPTELERIRGMVATFFPVYETQITPQSVVFHVHADPVTLDERFDRLRQQMKPVSYVPILRREVGEYLIEVLRRPPRGPSRTWVNWGLLIATAFTTSAAGAIIWASYRGANSVTGADFAQGALYFAVPLMTILGVHELAHFLVARRHHVEASLPYFIPVPPPFLIFGTFGAFISLREPIPDKRALLDIGVSGPLAGFAIAIPVALGGLALSAHFPVLNPAACGVSVLGFNVSSLAVGSSLIWAGLSLLIPVGLFSLHPLALAGWVGILVTAINLLPAGQLDGGHVFRALLGDRARYVSYGATAVLFVLGFFYTGWFLFAFLILILGVRHPPPLNDITPLDSRRIAAGLVGAAVLLTGFVVVPLVIPTGAFLVTSHGSTPAPMAGFGMGENLSLSVSNHDVAGQAFVLSGTVTSVVGGGNASMFLQNSTWVVLLPTGARTTFAGNGSFAMSDNNYTLIGPGEAARMTVTYLNLQAATVTIVLTVSELCAGSSGGPRSVPYTVG